MGECTDELVYFTKVYVLLFLLFIYVLTHTPIAPFHYFVQPSTRSSPKKHIPFRQSILQAVKTARNTSIWWYVRVFSAIVFFGGFFLKSLIDDRIRKHDVKRILAFYKQAAPGTMNDGDNHNAQYLCWKYKGTKDKLWRRLETKYGEPVKELHEYEAMADEEEDGEEKKEEEKSNDETNEDEEEDLDKDTSNGDL